MEEQANTKLRKCVVSNESNPFLHSSPIRVTGKDILDRVVELVYRQGGDRDLSEGSFPDNMPGLVRYKQIMELFEIFEIRANFAKFCAGGFLIDRSPDIYAELISTIMRGAEGEKVRGFKAVIEAFSFLFSYKCAAANPLRHGSGILAGEYGLSFAYHRMNRANEVIKTEIEKIDDILWDIIDPEKRTLIFELPHEKIKFLAYDISEIDMAYM